MTYNNIGQTIYGRVFQSILSYGRKNLSTSMCYSSGRVFWWKSAKRERILFADLFPSLPMMCTPHRDRNKSDKSVIIVFKSEYYYHHVVLMHFSLSDVAIPHVMSYVLIKASTKILNILLKTVCVYCIFFLLYESAAIKSILN